MKLRLSAIAHPPSSAVSTPVQPKAPSVSGGVSIEELLALRQVDLVVAPELAGELSHPTMFPPVGGDHLRLGPPPEINSEPSAVRRAIGGLLETFEHRRSLPASGSANAAVSEAKMIAVLAQLHRLQIEITAAARRVA